MCYHYSLTALPEVIEERFTAELQSKQNYSPVYHTNGFTHPAMPVITADQPQIIQLYHWGLIPHFMKTAADARQISNKTLNAIGEEVFEKPSFRNYITKKRCLVLADGLYEWMHLNRKAYPHLVYFKNHQPFAFAGIYSHWVDEQTGEIIKTYSILTTKANGLMSRIHNTKLRMPVILHPDREGLWLDQSLPKGKIADLILPYDDTLMQAHPISRDFSSKTFDTNVPEIQSPVTYPELAMIS